MATPPGYSLAAIAAVSPSDVWSVGARGDAGASGALAGVQSHSFVVHYDGVGWHETSVPDVGPLTAVAATSDGEAWALGPAGVILHWAGLQWKPAATAAQNGGAVLRGLAAVAANDVWAVGSAQGTPFATHWNGAAWQTAVLPATPGGGSLNAISGTATDLWAVGVAADATHVLTLHYDGATWSSVLDAGVSDGGLLTVATIAPNDVWAGGDALLQHYDGSNGATCRRRSAACAKRWRGSRRRTSGSAPPAASLIGTAPPGSRSLPARWVSLIAQTPSLPPSTPSRRPTSGLPGHSVPAAPRAPRWSSTGTAPPGSR